MRAKATDSILTRDILEWHVPEEVLAVLRKDRSTGHNLIWATDDYTARGKGFGANPICHTLCDNLSWSPHSTLITVENEGMVRSGRGACGLAERSFDWA